MIGYPPMAVTILLLLTCGCLASAHYHAIPNAKDFITGVPVEVSSASGRVARQAGRETIRIIPIYDSSVDSALPGTKSNMLRTQTVPKLIQFFQDSLSVDRVQENLLFERECTGSTFFPTTSLGPRGCEFTCATTMCGEVMIPEHHLKDCIQCNGMGSTDCERIDSGGTGVANADVVLYISAIDTNCPSDINNNAAQTVAFARTCQMEASLDRPIAGNVNFCPLGVTGNAADFVLELAKHETAHALAFASSLFAFWRDSNGTPRTSRNTNGLPMEFNSAGGFYVPSQDTIQFDVTYENWETINGVISHNVIHMVTPAVLREAREHFDCSSLAGVELENQGPVGTLLSHWEKRILGNEAMTGELTFNPVFSRISLAAFEDSGWYDVNYGMAQDLVWGRGGGCDFATRSCLSWINSQANQGLQPTPYCTNTERRCTVDHNAVGRCNLETNNPPVDYQYFNARTSGGRITIADYCPFQNSLSIMEPTRTRGTVCNEAANQPTVNVLSEVYGSGSRCIEHGTREWTNSMYTGFSTGSGCYQYSCSAETGVTIIVSGLAYQCSCEGEQLQFSFTDDSGALITASLRCPACSQLCYDTPASCPATEPATCYDRVTNVQGSTDLPTMPSAPGGNGATENCAVSMTTLIVAILVVTNFF